MKTTGILLNRRFVAAALSLFAGIGFWSALPDPLFRDPLSSVIVSSDGHLLGARISADEQWRFPENHVVPSKFRQALIRFEDKRFYSHPGVDPMAVARALFLNLRHHRKVSGASTLSMQVIRLARKNPHRTLLEKVIEMALAVRLELGYSKEEILALYASHAPFGGNTVGLDAAAWRYYGRDASTLTWAESCLLAVLPNSPSLMHPGKNRAALKSKRDQLLQALYREGSLSATDLKLALAEPLPGAPHELPRLAPHLLNTTIARSSGDGSRYQTTIDYSLQRAANSIVAGRMKILSGGGVNNAAAIIIDNRTFEVLAYVGNFAGDTGPEGGYAVDIIQSPRSSGSLLKPILFASMLQAGEILPDTYVADVPTQYEGYMPENFDRKYRGAVTARFALAHSLNVPAVRLLRKHGVLKFYQHLKRLGMSTLYRPAGGYGLTLILGGAEGTLWDMTSIYANLASLARAEQPSGKYRMRRVRWLQDQRPQTGPVMSIGPGSAYLTMKALLDVNRPGDEHYWKNFSSTRKVAWKTGTSFGERDAWSIGSTSHYTVGVWVGNASGEGRPGLTGASAAAPIMFDLFNRLPRSPWFKPPLADLKEVTVCKRDGFLSNGLCETKKELAPVESHFDRISRNFILVHLNESQTWRVHGQCERVSKMVHKTWFVLPPAEEFYYRKRHANYRTLPKFRPDCENRTIAHDGSSPIEFLYPSPGTRFYIPVDLNAKKSRVVFEAVHRNEGETLFWHLDNQYIGKTKLFHQQALDIPRGLHRITVVDSEGNSRSRSFEVLEPDVQQSAGKANRGPESGASVSG